MRRLAARVGEEIWQGPKGPCHRGEKYTVTVVSAKQLGLTFHTGDGDVVALSDVDLDIAPGEFVSFIGPSGCGKTTFLRVIADLEQPTSGTITVNGMTPMRRAQSRVLWLCVPGAGAVSLAHHRKERRSAARDHGLSRGRAESSASPASWSWSTSPASSANIPGSCRAACSSAPRSPARWPSMPTCC